MESAHFHFTFVLFLLGQYILWDVVNVVFMTKERGSDSGGRVVADSAYSCFKLHLAEGESLGVLHLGAFLLEMKHLLTTCCINLVRQFLTIDTGMIW